MRCTKPPSPVDAARILLRALGEDCAPNLPPYMFRLCYFRPPRQSPPPLRAFTGSRPFPLRRCLARCHWFHRGRLRFLRRTRRRHWRQWHGRRGRLRLRAEFLTEAARPQHPTSPVSATARQRHSSIAEAARPQHPTPLQVQFILNPWQTTSILHLSMADEVSQSDLPQLALHLADVVVPSVQVPLCLRINPVGILHGNSKNIC